MKLYTFTLKVRDKKKGTTETMHRITAVSDDEALTKLSKRFKDKAILTFSVNKVTEVEKGDEIFVVPFQTPIQPEDWDNKRMFVINPNYIFPSKLDWDKVLNKTKSKKEVSRKTNKQKKQKQFTREQATLMLEILQRMEANHGGK